MAVADPGAAADRGDAGSLRDVVVVVGDGRATEVKRHGAQFWDENPCGGAWSDYGSYLRWYEQTEPDIFRIVRRIPWSGKRVLDIGCGQGAILQCVTRQGAAAVGIDMSLVSLQRAARGAHEIREGDRPGLVTADAERLPFGDSTFDAVLSIGVLHHTPDTRAGVDEVWRVLRPGGLALVMLYRTNNPKWWATRATRMVASRRLARLVDRPRDSVRGTALLELFGCPTLKAFSNREAREMFRRFGRVTITNVSPGFRRLVDIAPILAPVGGVLRAIDRTAGRVWGFYQVIEAWK